MGRGTAAPLSSGLLYGPIAPRARAIDPGRANVDDRAPLWWAPPENEEYLALEVTSELLTFLLQDRQRVASETLERRIHSTMKMRIESIDNAVETIVSGVHEVMLGPDSRLILAHRWLGDSVGTISVLGRFCDLELVDKSLDLEIVSA